MCVSAFKCYIIYFVKNNSVNPYSFRAAFKNFKLSNFKYPFFAHSQLFSINLLHCILMSQQNAFIQDLSNSSSGQPLIMGNPIKTCSNMDFNSNLNLKFSFIFSQYFRRILPILVGYKTRSLSFYLKSVSLPSV